MNTLGTDIVDVAVIGAGPTGLMLAGELAMRGVRVQVLERRAQEPNITRAFAVHARTLELLDARGLAGEMLARGFRVGEVAPIPGATISLADELRMRYPFILMVPQSGTEHVLAAHAERLGVRISRGAELAGLEQHDDGVTLTVAGGGSLRARYVVGCDGAHSAVRRLLGVDFVGKQYQTHIMLADVQLTRPPAEQMFARTNAEGVVLVLPFGDGWYRAIAWDRRREHEPLTEPVTAAQIRDAIARIAGEDFGLNEMRWSSRFLSERRQARHYRVGRVFLAGDAAHVHSPIGGQGMNTGIGDAMNLGWKLALVANGALDGQPSESLLDSYESERHPVGAEVLAMTDMFTQLVLGRSAVRRLAQGLAIRTILRFPRSRRAIAERLSGVAIRYPRRRPADHPLVGRRMPDVDCNGIRLYEVLRSGHFVLLTRGTRRTRVDWPGVEEVNHYDATQPAAVLVRPDGYVAWAARRTPTAAEVAEVLKRWYGCLSRAQPGYALRNLGARGS
ncbi:FAD-dependent monooxygenase [Mycobacterium sp. TY815]|uniref:FAD-dependent monooxygenase n=1 Tax=Mycobacterium sp. TY815 TaxID=3050581 RepID=UPI002741BE0E|nr:FAD-dependent monooxygenase [Mycobacterium sp. TY815]MDP7702043.1 FAD-dependent monooxygenase [Mycobacterium sp. TY815]